MDCDGIIEYAKWYKDWYFSNAEVVGKHVLDVYPTLTRETSTIMQCINRKEILPEKEVIFNHPFRRRYSFF